MIFHGYLWRVIENAGISYKDIVKDIISDAYFLLWNQQEKLEIEKPILPYLVGITKNLIKRHFSKISRQAVEINIEDFENSIFDLAELDTKIVNQELMNKILMIINHLKEEDKQIFLKYYFDGKKAREIAVENNISESKVKTKLHRLRKLIKKEIQKGDMI